MKNYFAKPPIELLAAAFLTRHRQLTLAFATTGRAVEPDMLVIIVFVLGPHLVEPAAIRAGLLAQLLFDGGVDEHPIDLRIERGGPDEPIVSG